MSCLMTEEGVEKSSTKECVFSVYSKLLLTLFLLLRVLL